MKIRISKGAVFLLGLMFLVGSLQADEKITAGKYYYTQGGHKWLAVEGVGKIMLPLGRLQFVVWSPQGESLRADHYKWFEDSLTVTEEGGKKIITAQGFIFGDKGEKLIFYQRKDILSPEGIVKVHLDLEFLQTVVYSDTTNIQLWFNPDKFKGITFTAKAGDQIKSGVTLREFSQDKFLKEFGSYYFFSSAGVDKLRLSPDFGQIEVNDVNPEVFVTFSDSRAFNPETGGPYISLSFSLLRKGANKGRKEVEKKSKIVLDYEIKCSLN